MIRLTVLFPVFIFPLKVFAPLTVIDAPWFETVKVLPLFKKVPLSETLDTIVTLLGEVPPPTLNAPVCDAPLYADPKFTFDLDPILS